MQTQPQPTEQTEKQIYAATKSAVKELTTRFHPGAELKIKTRSARGFTAQITYLTKQTRIFKVGYQESLSNVKSTIILALTDLF